MEKNNGISDSRYKSRFFKKLAAWMGKHGAALTAVVLIAVSAILGCAEATIIYAAKDNGASNDYGTRGNTSSPSYICLWMNALFVFPCFLVLSFVVISPL